MIIIDTAGTSLVNPVPFTVTRPIQGRFNPPAGLARAGYRAIADGDVIPVDPTTGEFTGAVATDQAAVVWLYRSAADPAFLALVPPNASQPVIDAASTAEALVLINPMIQGRSIDRYNAFVTELRSSTELGELTSSIATVAGAGRDPLDDARVEGALIRAAQRLLTSSFTLASANQTFEPGSPRGTRLRYLNPPAGAFGIPNLRRLQTSIAPPDNDHPGTFRLKFESAGRFQPFENPVDWFIKFYELQPQQFAAGFASINALASTDAPLKAFAEPLGSATVGATLFSKNLDVLDVVAGFITDKFFAQTVDQIPGFIAPNEFPVPSLRPGVYVSEAYSGNLYFGTEVFRNSPPSQSALITQLEGRTTWAVSLGGNVMVAAVDLIGVIGGFGELFKKSRARVSGVRNDTEFSTLAQIIDGIAQDTVKGVLVHGNRPITRETVYDLIKSAGSSLVKNLSAKALEDPSWLGEEYGESWLKMYARMFDWAGKISSALQAVERSTGLLGNSVLAVERSVVVVGNPFAPSLQTFFPQRGRGGDTLTIHGTNFGANTNELRVSFRQFANTEDPTSWTARVDLPVVTANPTSIVVRLPQIQFVDEFPNRRAFVVVEVAGTNLVGSSAALSPPFREFRFLEPPTITSVTPNPVRAGGYLELGGLGFDHELAREFQILIDGQAQTLGRAADAGGTRMSLLVPANLSAGSHQIAIRYRESTNASFPFTVERPVSISTVDERGWEVLVTRADLSTAPDGEISVLEAFLIVRGQLGRPIEQHLDCENLPASDPEHCPPQRRETDFVRGDEPNVILGPVNSITFPGGLVFTGTLPALSNGDRYFFGSTSGTNVQPFIVDGSSSGANANGLVLDGLRGVYVSGRSGGLVLRNFSGHGVHLRNGARENHLEEVTVENCGGNGFLVDGNASANELRNVSVNGAGGHGVHFTGGGVRHNVFASLKGRVLPPTRNYDVIRNCGGNGIRIDSGANFNEIMPGTIRNCRAAGIAVVGASYNFFGRVTDELGRHYDLVSNEGPGLHVGPGSVGNVFRYLNPIGNQGDGVLLEGPGCSNNIVDRTYAGVNLYEGGTSPVIPNEGSGIRLTSGAQFNLVGSVISSLGERGAICGNRDDGVRLEGAGTAFNTVNAQNIGVLDPNAAVSQLRFFGNDRSGIALRNGARDNIVGDANSELANAIFDCPDAGIEMTGAGTDRNRIFGNQIGAFHAQWVLPTRDPASCHNGIWIHDGPRDNTIGLPSAAVIVPRFPGDPLGAPHHTWNSINGCTNAGVLIENAGGTVGTDGELAGANVVQANYLGVLDNGQLAPSGPGAGIILGPGAQGNVIGGPLPILGNRIRGWYRAGLWIDRNHLPHPRQRNRIENNFIEGAGLGISFRYMDYLTNTPSGGVGVLVTDSSGHEIGESQLTRNTLYVNRLGLYLANSSNNRVRGFYVTNSFNAGAVIRGGTGNAIGGSSPGEGNRIHAFGFPNEAAWAGLALSHTTENQVRANEIGWTAPGRGASGLLLLNASNNELGGSSPIHGNTIVSNFAHGIVLSGPGTVNNRLFNNFVGRTRDGAEIPNRGDGIRCETGAQNNFVGGLASAILPGFGSVEVPAGNVIAGNLGAGVRVVGATTVGNRILYNQITANGGRGIAHENGGNHLMPPPVLLAYNGSVASGTVSNLAVTPPGSVVQIFCDPSSADPEGDAFLGQAVVQANGLWRATLTGKRRHPVLTMTATHAGHGSTSEFGTGTPEAIGLRVARTDGETAASTVAGALRAAVLRLTLTAINSDVRVKSIALDANGTLPDATAVTAAQLYHDADEDGLVTDADFPLGAPVHFSADDGRIAFSELNVLLEANKPRRWIVAYGLASTAPVEATFQLILTNAAAVSAEFSSPLDLEAEATGSFPIRSANYTVTAGPTRQTFGSWQTGVFTPTQLANPNVSGATADADGDRVLTIVEYAFNLNPLVADRETSPSNDRGLPQASLVRGFAPETQSFEDYLEIAFVRRAAPVDLTYLLEDSADLQSWAPAETSFLALTSSVDISGSLQRVRYRATEPIASGLRRFVRVQIQQVP